MTWLLLLPAYALGTFPSAVWIAHTKDIDITSVGSGNPGASNISRALGKRLGLLVFLLDGLKGAIPAAGGLLLDDRALAWALAAAAVIGHMFPVTRRFKGGKGVATMAGGAIVLQPVISAILAVLWYVTLKASKKASLASLVVMVGLPAGIAIKRSPGWEVAFAAGINTVVFVRHLGNFKRLLTGKELSTQRLG